VSFANKNVSGLQKYLRFQNDYNKVEIELRVVQFWTEIKLVITNRTPASRSCDFVITRLISVPIALHSVQLPLLMVGHLFVIAVRDKHMLSQGHKHQTQAHIQSENLTIW
jgi:hypothetical protein